MDSERVTGSESEGRNEEDHSASFTSYTEYFNRLCPFYLNAGMTYDQFWHGDAQMARAYRKAREIALEDQNFKLWLQGRYFYDALCCVAPIFRALSKAKSPIEYHDQPIPLSNEALDKRKKQIEEKRGAEARKMMEAFAERFNKEFDERNGKEENHG